MAPMRAVALSILFILVPACTPDSTVDVPIDNGDVITGTGGAPEPATQASTPGSTPAGTGGAASSSAATGGEAPSCPDSMPGEQNESETTAYKMKADNVDD